MKIRLGFDEIYVVAKNDTTLECECIYDSFTADEKVKELRKKGFDRVEKITLEYAYLNGYLVPQY